jgi:hypothetical protein
MRGTSKRFSQNNESYTGKNQIHKWVPVSKRLPNDYEFRKNYIRNEYAAEFIVMIEGANKPTCLYYRKGRWFDDNGNYYKVVAWMPMPEPYKEGQYSD